MKRILVFLLSFCLLVPSAASGATGTVRIPIGNAKIVSLTNVSRGVFLHWKKVSGADGYYVYRKGTDELKWKKVGSKGAAGKLYATDTAAKVEGTAYSYIVRAYRCGVAASSSSMTPGQAESGVKKVWMSPPKVRSAKKPSSRTFRVIWNMDTEADGYLVQYSNTSLFNYRKSVTIRDPEVISRTFSGLTPGTRYYARVAAFKNTSGGRAFSAWCYSSNVKKDRIPKVSYNKKRGRKLDYRKLTGQKLYGYDTFQGACSDGKYSYHIMYNRNNEKCRIAKVRVSSGRVAKVSRVLPVGHGNDITYNKRHGTLVVVHYTGNAKALTVVSARTLKRIRKLTVKIPTSLYNVSSSSLRKIRGFTGIAYDSARAEYVLTLKESRNMLVLDDNFVPQRYIKVNKYNNYTNQGIECNSEFIVRAQSRRTSGQKYNILTVYDWNGNYISKTKVNRHYELENVYFAGSRLYAGLYHSYTKTKYKWVKKRYRSGRRGRLRTRYVFMKYHQLYRSNYIFRIMNY
ncbi:MAG: fibronectin type III domain-containing protein [Anaerovoracaceae bacterium]